MKSTTFGIRSTSVQKIKNKKKPR